MISGCDHKYVFLRQDIKPTKQWDGRILERKVVDVFFCERCLTYTESVIRVEEPDPRRLGWRAVV